MKRKILAVILVGGMLLATTACGQQETEEPQIVLEQEEVKETYPTVTAEYGDVVKNITIRCSYESTEKQELAFPVDDGLIESVDVKIGDYVTEGQLLAALDVDDVEEKIEDLEYQISAQELKLKQTEEMKAFELASAERMYTYTSMKEEDQEDLKEKNESINEQYRTTLEDLTDTLTIQKKRLQQYRQELEDGMLYADINGEVTYVEGGLQETYSIKDRVVVVISDVDSCYFVSDDIEYADCFEEGTSVELKYRDSGIEMVCEIVPVQKDSWDEMMYFKPVQQEIISSSTTGSVTVELARKENVLCIVEDAIHESDLGPFVYLEKDGVLEMRYVTTGLEGDTMIEITGGLEPGEIVAIKKNY